MPSKPPERRAIGYTSPERRLEVGWRRKRRELRSLVAPCPSLYAFLPSTRSLRTPHLPCFSACFLLSAYFLAAACYKRMRLTTSFYGITCTPILITILLYMVPFAIYSGDAVKWMVQAVVVGHVTGGAKLVL